MRLYRCIAALVLIQALAVQPAGAYSVLTHEAIIDLSWEPEIKPLLKKRFPDTTDEQYKEAHAYAYGGAIIQDMGYYPFGSRLFSDLVHYSRSGDFVMALVRDAADVKEYAFALGALAHYSADNEGHPVAINRAVPMAYPKLRAKFGSTVTYEDDPGAHLKTEFGFDVIQVARGQYASEAYHDFVGFKVAKPLLERAFEETYGLPLKSLFKSLDLALGTYRFSVGRVIPEMSKAAWDTKKADIQKLQAGMTQRKFVYRLSRRAYHKEWTENYEKPGAGARFLAFLFRIMPKVGPFKALAFKVPPLEAEKLFITSFNDTISRYHSLIVEVRENRLRLPNQNFDTGQPTHRAEYKMADDAYEKLLDHLAGSPDKIPDDLRANILSFYGDSEGPPSEKGRALLATLRSQH